MLGRNGIPHVSKRLMGNDNLNKKKMSCMRKNTEWLTMTTKCNHKMKIVGYCFGGFKSNPYYIKICSNCKKYAWNEIPDSEIL